MNPFFDNVRLTPALAKAYRFFPAKESSLDLDFINDRQKVAGVYGAVMNSITFTRSTTGTYFGADGSLKTAAINEPRFEYDRITQRPLGLLIEESRSNLVLNSNTPVTQNVTVAAAEHTLSFYGTGTIALSGASAAGPLVGTGANNRVSLTFTSTAGTLTLTISGAVSSMQLEAGSSVTSYIPTTSASVTRGADVVSITGANFSNWYNQAEGTIFIESEGVVAGAPALYSIDDTTSSNRIIGQYASVANAAWRVVSGGVDQWNDSHSNLIGLGGRLAHVLAYSLNNFAGTANGLAPLVDSIGTVPSVSRMIIGANVANIANLNGYVRRIIYYPKRLSTQMLAELTRYVQ